MRKVWREGELLDSREGKWTVDCDHIPGSAAVHAAEQRSLHGRHGRSERPALRWVTPREGEHRAVLGIRGREEDALHGEIRLIVHRQATGQQLGPCIAPVGGDQHSAAVGGIGRRERVGRQRGLEKAATGHGRDDGGVVPVVRRELVALHELSRRGVEGLPVARRVAGAATTARPQKDRRFRPERNQARPGYPGRLRERHTAAGYHTAVARRRPGPGCSARRTSAPRSVRGRRSGSPSHGLSHPGGQTSPVCQPG